MFARRLVFSPAGPRRSGTGGWLLTGERIVRDIRSLFGLLQETWRF